MLAAGGTFPDWTDDDLRELVARGRRREPPWSARCAPGARASSPSRSPSRRTGRTRRADCSACRTSYDGAARLAGLRGWPVLLGPDDRPGGHFAMLVDPESVADDLETLVSRL